MIDASDQTQFMQEGVVFEPSSPASAQSTLPSPDQPGDPQKKKSSSKTILIAGGVAVFLLLVVGLLVAMMSSQNGGTPIRQPEPEMTAEEMVLDETDPQQAAFAQLERDLQLADPSREELPFPPIVLEVRVPEL